MSLVVDYFRELFRAARDGWNRFWFTPSDPATLGLIRILAGAMLLYTHVVWTLGLERFSARMPGSRPKPPSRRFAMRGRPKLRLELFVADRIARRRCGRCISRRWSCSPC